MNRKQHFRTHVQGESLENQINLLYDKITEILLLPIVIIYFYEIFQTSPLSLAFDD